MTRARTTDLQSRAAAQARDHPVYTVEQLGPNRKILPNGNLLCLNVPIARTGWLVYGPGEVPVAPGPGGVAYVERTADALFNPKTMGSFTGAAVVNEHPPDDVDPTNWNVYSGGFAINIRQGTGDDADVLLADLMVTRKDLIDDILSGKVEVSAGYDADYQDRGGGVGRQHNLTGNHIALVRKGRCGPRCAIGDHAYQANPPTQEEREPMPQVNTPGARRARKTLDADTLASLRDAAQQLVANLGAADEDDGQDDDGVHVHIHGAAEPAAGAGVRTTDAATLDRIADLEEGQTAILSTLDEIKVLLTARTGDAAPAGEDEGAKTYDAEDDSDEAKAWRAKMAKKKTGDAAYDEGSSKALHTAYTELMAQAEVLVPGFKVPTFDAAFTRAKTIDRMCSARRLCLSQFATTDSGAAMLRGLNGGQDAEIVSMDCKATAALFKTAAAAKGALNNAAGTQGANRTTDGERLVLIPGAQKVPSIAEINEANRKFWEGK